MIGDWRGVLYPAGLPTFHRLPPPAPVEPWVRWFWIPEWHLAPGRVSRQYLLPFLACNLVVQPDLVGISGPATRRSHRDLEGRGWAVGALLRPAAVAHLVDDPGGLRDEFLVLDLPGLHAEVSAAMTAEEDPAARRDAAVTEVGSWLVGRLPPPDDEAHLANAMTELIDTDPTVVRAADAADRLGVSARTLQRIARRYVGVPPAAMIRRRRLQEAAERLRTDATADIAAVAAALGYADHAHLTADFRTVLGFTPSDYRRGRTSPGAACRR